jgi:GNAT superfamily N-acetyltransferase
MMSQLEIRSYQPADIWEVLPLLNRCLTEDPITSETFQRKVLLDQNFSPRGTLVARADGRIVGFALGMVRSYKIEDSAPDFDRSWITLLAVDEAYRKQGIATQLVQKLEAYFKENKCASTWVASYAPNYFIPGVDVAAYPEALEFFKKMGWTEVYRPLAMDADLVHLETPKWVLDKEKKLVEEGVAVETYRPELIQPLMDFMLAEFPGDWQRFARDAMTRITTGEYHPTNLWIAHARGKVLGFVQHDNVCRFGPFGVAGKERGRGIGAVLLLKVMHAMRGQGMHNAWFLWTDDKVAELYAAAGFVETRRFAVLKKAL